MIDMIEVEEKKTVLLIDVKSDQNDFVFIGVCIKAWPNTFTKKHCLHSHLF